MAAVMNRSRLLDVMNLRHWSQGDLARVAKVPQSTISRLLSGQMEPSGITIGKLLAATGLAYDELFDQDVVAAQRYYTTAEVARRLGCSNRMIQRLVHRGELSAMKLGQSRYAPWRFTEVEVSRFVAAQRRSAS